MYKELSPNKERALKTGATAVLGIVALAGCSQQPQERTQFVSVMCETTKATPVVTEVMQDSRSGKGTDTIFINCIDDTGIQKLVSLGLQDEPTQNSIKVTYRYYDGFLANGKPDFSLSSQEGYGQIKMFGESDIITAELVNNTKAGE